MAPDQPSEDYTPENPQTAAVPSPEKKKLSVANGEKLRLEIEMAEGAAVQLHIVNLDENGQEKNTNTRTFLNSPVKTAYRVFKQKLKNHWPTVLIVSVLLIYLASRFIGLDRFPIYFFCDEAVQTNLAANLVHNGLKDEMGELLPTFLANAGQYEMGPSVYLQVLPYLIFGKSIWVTRGVCVLFTLLAAIAIGLMSMNIFRSKYPYLAILILCITPTWFLHSRTAFETGLATSFYAVFIYCYLMYRQEKLKYVYGALVFGVLALYTYSPVQLVVGVTFIGLLLFDLKYHWQHRKLLLKVFGLAAILAIPYIRFLILHPDENYHQMQILGSFWLDNSSLGHKLGIYFGNYLQLLNPAFWFDPNYGGIIRHIMKGYGQFFWWSAPLVALGLVLTLLHIKRPEYRALLIVLLAAPTGSSLVGPGITRTMILVIPVVLFAAIALDQVIHWLSLIRIKPAVTAAICLVGMIGITGYMVYDVNVNAPTWYDDYTLSGLQYGSRELFPEIKQFIQENPDKKLMVSSEWANDPQEVAAFYFNDPLPFTFGSIEMWINQQLPLPDNQVFVVIPSELEAVKTSNKFKSLEILKTLPYPNGQPGFYFVKAEYVDDIDQVFAQEVAARHALIPGEATLHDGTKVTIEYPHLDMGEIGAIFDNNNDTLIRTESSNPMVLKLTFFEPYKIKSVTFRVGGAPTTVTATAAPSDMSADITIDKKVPVSSEVREITLTFDKEILVSSLELSIKNTEDTEPAHVHLWEVKLNEN
jgi:4-amino-4-deoxy-L-arabinose transferase-like glycosyltransferase